MLNMALLLRVVNEGEHVIINQVVEEVNPSVEVGSNTCETSQEPDFSVNEGKPRMHTTWWGHRHAGHTDAMVFPKLQFVPNSAATSSSDSAVVTVSVITFSYDIETGCSWMRWKGDDDAVVLDLVLATEGPWIILCDHGVLRHLFGPTWPCIVSGLKPKLWAPNPRSSLKL